MLFRDGLLTDAPELPLLSRVVIVVASVALNLNRLKFAGLVR